VNAAVVDLDHWPAPEVARCPLPVPACPGCFRAAIRDIEAWFRRRTDIEDRIREAKLGAGLRRLPSGRKSVNTAWMWAALLAGTSRCCSKPSPGSTAMVVLFTARLRH